MTAVVSTVDRLAGALCKGNGDRYCINYDPDVADGCTRCQAEAQYLVDTGVVVTADTLADEMREKFCDCPGAGLPADQHSPDGCRGLMITAALAERCQP